MVFFIMFLLFFRLVAACVYIFEVSIFCSLVFSYFCADFLFFSILKLLLHFFVLPLIIASLAVCFCRSLSASLTRISVMSLPGIKLRSGLSLELVLRLMVAMSLLLLVLRYSNFLFHEFFLQLLHVLSARPVFSVKGAIGVGSVQCSDGLRALLEQSV